MAILVTVAVNAFAGRILVPFAHVASGANELGMTAQKRETRQIVIEPDIRSPARLGVTLGATQAQLAGVRVVLAMTSPAGGIQLHLRGGFDVAGRASKGRVSAKQGKGGHPGVVERCRLPVGDAMARTAIAAVLSAVHIVPGVTGTAFARQVNLDRGLRMT
jgi:hypothetical protein